MTNQNTKRVEEIVQEFRTCFPVSIDYPPIPKNSETFALTQIEIDARYIRALNIHHEQERFILKALLSYASEQKEEGMREERERIVKLIRSIKYGHKTWCAEYKDDARSCDCEIQEIKRMVNNLLTAITPSVGGDKEGE